MRFCINSYFISFVVFVVFRTSGGRLHLLPDVGKIVLADATLVEDPSDSEREDDGIIKLYP